MRNIISYIKNLNKTYSLASALFPKEKWIHTEAHIWVAKSRLAQKEKEPKKWEKEMLQARILTGRGSVAFFLPEIQNPNDENMSADLVLDGEVLEMKTVTGTRTTLSGKFKMGYKQGAFLLKDCKITKRHSVFIRLLSDLSIGSVKAKIAGELKYRYDEGSFICYFENIKELHIWDYKELRAIIGT